MRSEPWPKDLSDGAAVPQETTAPPCSVVAMIASTRSVQLQLLLVSCPDNYAASLT